MADFVRRRPLEVAVSLTIAATVVLFVLGSGSVVELVAPAHRLRWIALFVLAALALFAARDSWRDMPLQPLHVLLAAFVALSVVSVLWTVDRTVTIERAATLAAALVAAVALGVWASAESDRAWSVVAGIAAGALVICIWGFLLVAVNHGTAVQPADPGTPWRFRGIGGNPNTIPLLGGVVAPACLGLFLARNRLLRTLGAATLVGLLVTIAFSGSRGGWAAATGGSIVTALVAPMARRRRVRVVAGVVATFGATLALGAIPSTAPLPVSTTPPQATPGAGTASAPYPLLLSSSFGACHQEDQIGRPAYGQTLPPLTRSIFGASGRGQAWEEALRQARDRPVLGYGFGTEDRVFFDCFYTFYGARPENSYLGILLQLGGVGLILLVAVGLAAGLAAFRGVRSDDRNEGLIAAAGLGAFVAGAIAAAVQSYVYSVGNVSTLSFWTLVLLAASLGLRRTGAPLEGHPA